MEPWFGNLELLHSWYFSHSFCRHAHHTYAIAVIQQGAEKFAYQGASYIVTNTSLEQLAALSHVSPFYLLRTFRQQVGLPPYGYLDQVHLIRCSSLSKVRYQGCSMRVVLY
jgi:AraC-like DNA-binding protein